MHQIGLLVGIGGEVEEVLGGASQVGHQFLISANNCARGIGFYENRVGWFTALAAKQRG